MLLYILDPWDLERAYVVEEYDSCVWAERYNVLGDFTITLGENATNAKRLRPGVVIENEEADCPMLIESAEIKDDSLTITGRTLESFFDERSLSPRSKTGNPREIMQQIVDDMQSQYGYDFSVWDVVTRTPAAGGTDVTEKIKERTPVYQWLSAIAKKYNVGMKVIRHRNDDYYAEYGIYYYEWRFQTWLSTDYSEGNADGTAVIRFSPDDDNLIGAHEIYNAVDNVEAVIVYVPDAFSGPGGLGDPDDPDGVKPVIYTRSGYVDTLDEVLDDESLVPFDTRTKEVTSNKITVKYLTEQIPIRYSMYVDSPFWTLLPTYQKRYILKEEMKRLAEAEFKKTVGQRKRAIDGEVSFNSFRFGTDYDLGDIVEISTGIEDGSHNRKAQVTEYIRTADSSGVRAYPTLAEPSTDASYANDPSQQDDQGVLDYEDHTFSINGLLPADIETLSPHRVTVPEGSTVRIVSIGQTGPRDGTCTLYFIRNFSYFDEGDLPITCTNGDKITVDPTDNADGAAYVSGHFTIERSST